MSHPQSEGELSIAIIGAGIAALTLVYGLRNATYIKVLVFEASSELRVDGTAVGLGANAQQALHLIGPGLRAVLDGAGATRMDPHVRFVIGTGSKIGTTIAVIESGVSQVIVTRGHFLPEVRNSLPPGIMQMGKRLASVDSASAQDKVKLRFEDDTPELVDAVIGCDGINSIVRQAVLGAHHPATKPFYTGGHNHRVIIPIREAIEAFGADYCKQKTRFTYVGENGFLLTDIQNNRTTMQVIAGFAGLANEPVSWPCPTPLIPWPKVQIAKDLEPWGEVGKAMTKVFTSQPELYAAGGFFHRETPM